MEHLPCDISNLICVMQHQMNMRDVLDELVHTPWDHTRLFQAIHDEIKSEYTHIEQLYSRVRLFSWIRIRYLHDVIMSPNVFYSLATHLQASILRESRIHYTRSIQMTEDLDRTVSLEYARVNLQLLLGPVDDL